MMFDIKITQAQCLFMLIDNNIIMDDTLDKLMYNLLNNDYESYVYVMWLLTRWVQLRQHKFELPTNKKKDNYCVTCGHSILSNHNFCGNCGTSKITPINLNDVITECHYPESL